MSEWEQDTEDTLNNLYQDNVDYYANHWIRNGKLGAAIGFLKGVASVIGEIVGVTVRNFLFGDRERMNLKRTFEQYKAVDNFKSKNHEETKNYNTKEHFEQLRGNLEKEISKNTQTEQKDIKEKELQKVDEFLKSDIAKTIFKNYGFVPSLNKENIHLFSFQENTIGVGDEIFKKDNLLKKEAGELAAAIFASSKRNNPLGKQESVLKEEAALKASLITASVSFHMEKEKIKALLKEENSKNIQLSNISYQTVSGADSLKIYAKSNESGTLEIYLNKNDKLLSRIPLDCISGKESLEEPLYDFMKDHIHLEAKRNSFKTYMIGSKEQSLSFSLKDGHIACVSVKMPKQAENGREKYLGEFSFGSEEGVRKLSKALHDVGWDKKDKNKEMKLTSSSVAYTTAIITNPDMKFLSAGDNEYISPVSGKTVPGGAAHLSVIHNDKGIQIFSNLPKKDNTMKHSCIYKALEIDKIDVNHLASKVCEAMNQIFYSEKQNYAVDDYHRKQEKENVFDAKTCNHKKAMTQALKLKEEIALTTEKEIVIRDLIEKEKTFDPKKEGHPLSPDGTDILAAESRQEKDEESKAADTMIDDFLAQTHQTHFFSNEEIEINSDDDLQEEQTEQIYQAPDEMSW